MRVTQTQQRAVIPKEVTVACVNQVMIKTMVENVQVSDPISYNSNIKLKSCHRNSFIRSDLVLLGIYI